jgi:hypothetical protein
MLYALKIYDLLEYDFLYFGKYLRTKIMEESVMSVYRGAASPETLISVYQTTRRHIPEDRNLIIYRRESPKSVHFN